MDDGVERNMSWCFYESIVKESSMKEEKAVEEDKVIT